MDSNMTGKIRNTLGPLLLILLCPPSAILMWYTNTHLQGSFQDLFLLFTEQGIATTIYHIWQPVFFGSKTAWSIIAIFSIFQFMLMKFLPGKDFYGPVTRMGNVPVYKANGVAAFIITLITFIVASFYLHLFSASIIYDNFGYILGALNILSLSVCLLLYFKGRFFPSSTDSGITDNFIFDYYWGTELYPQLFGISLKKFITCRFGMMSWSLILLSYAAKQNELSGFLSNSLLVSIALQLIYVAKFYVWETGYLRSLDIMHDRAGFYICWGCLVWVPCIYTSPSMYLVLHPIELSTWLAAGIFMLGAFCILINYLADRQRQLVRATNGECKIWGKAPLITIATYTTEQNETKTNILLASGWWGISRHFHYVPEILAAFFWSLPALFSNFAPYFYVSFLTVLLVDRAFRDDRRCALKYTTDWKMYCKLVRYKILPYVV
jgi:7-dehydrocholesterol reductase